MVTDPFSRRMQGFAVFPKRPSAEDTCVFLNRAVERTGKKPKYLISDKGKQFDCNEVKTWYRERGLHSGRLLPLRRGIDPGRRIEDSPYYEYRVPGYLPEMNGWIPFADEEWTAEKIP